MGSSVHLRSAARVPIARGRSLADLRDRSRVVASGAVDVAGAVTLRRCTRLFVRQRLAVTVAIRATPIEVDDFDDR